ncbi:MAG: JAB domain-containing protein [Bacteroidetes bacterium]|nr:JAB domain-containing protein [Bacteroidota bacterium]
MASKKEFLNELRQDWKHSAISIKLNRIYVKDIQIKRVSEVYEFLKEIWDQDLLNIQEQFAAIYFNQNNKVIGYRLLNTGGSTFCIVDIKLLVCLALHSMANCVIIAHNHPSGNLTPSKQDEALTIKIKEALSLIDVKLIDHIIIAEGGFFSFAEVRLL